MNDFTIEYIDKRISDEKETYALIRSKLAHIKVIVEVQKWIHQNLKTM